MKKILIIDDNPHLISYMEKKLREAGHEVVTESSGLSAIQKLAGYTPDIIFTDYFLPNINGDKLCQIIRKMEHLKNAYLVVMSAAAKELQLDPSGMCANAVIAKGTFKETVKHFFSAIADAQKCRSDKQGYGVMGIESVYPRQMTMELLEKYRHLQAMLDSISEGIVEIYRGRIVYANPAAVTILGKQQDQLLAARPPALFDESERPKVESVMGSEDGSSAIVNWKGSMELENKVLSIKKILLQGDPDTIILLITDITEQVYAEEALRGYQNHLEALVEERTADLEQERDKSDKTLYAIGDGVITVDHKGKILSLNRVAESLVGMDTSEAAGRQLEEVYVLRQSQENRFGEKCGILTGKVGNEYAIEEVRTPITEIESGKGGVVIVFRNITERKQAEDQIKASLREKEILLKEIQHRVKNNLLTISSILTLQVNRIKDDESKDAFITCMNRINALTKIHIRLYQSDNYSFINISGYIKELIWGLSSSYGFPYENMISGIEDISIDVNTAIPIGLIVNELVSNAMKHAFPDGRKGQITVTMSSEDSRIVLTVTDNGIGLPSNVDFKNTESVGLSLLGQLVEQINGSMELIRDNGTRFIITFSID